MNAIVLTAGRLNLSDAKTAHGLVRESGRFKIVGIIDELQAGRDAGEVLDGKTRNIPVFKTIEESLHAHPEYCIVGVATPGGVFPDSMMKDIKTAIRNGLTVVNGLHDLLGERDEIAELAKQFNTGIIDIRKPKHRRDLHFWTGDVLHLQTPVLAVLGTDCSLGKRTTQRILLNDLKNAGINAELIYTGQTGWLQGGEYGFIFDSTLNDFVPGELEHAILTCAGEKSPDIILLEGQSGLRNPTGPCGSEMIISGNAKHVLLVHAPKREFFHRNTYWGKMPSIESEIDLIGLLGAKVIGLALNTEDCSEGGEYHFRDVLEKELGVPVLLPLRERCERIIPVVKQLIAKR
jgi:uncharacterized NAD-dependent epimerase/dehydratase family protein